VVKMTSDNKIKCQHIDRDPVADWEAANELGGNYDKDSAYSRCNDCRRIINE